MVPGAALTITGLTTVALTASAVNDGTGLGTYVGTGAGAIAVAALAEVTRRLLNGRLIPRETRDTEAETAAYIVAAGQREDRAMKLAEEANRLFTDTASSLKQHNSQLAFDLAELGQRQTGQFLEALSTLTRAVHDLRDELRDNRREGR